MFKNTAIVIYIVIYIVNCMAQLLRVQRIGERKESMSRVS